MKLIKPSYKIIEQEPGLDGIYKAIESAGRTCYKSEDKITDTSAKEFVDRIIKSGHLAMLEFGTVYLNIPVTAFVDGEPQPSLDKTIGKYLNNPYTKAVPNNKYAPEEYFITTNYRHIVENGWLDDLKYLCKPTEFHEKRVCVKFTTDRGTANELVRHRTFSYSQESTRQWRH